MTFGAKIKKYREEHCMTQQTLADMLGVTKQEISRFESNHIMPRKQTVEHYAQVLDLPVSYLMCEHIVTEDGLDLTNELIRKQLWRYIDADEYGTPVLSFPGLVDNEHIREVEVAYEERNQEYKKNCEELNKHPLGRREVAIIIQLRQQPELRIAVERILGISNERDEKPNKNP